MRGDAGHAVGLEPVAGPTESPALSPTQSAITPGGIVFLDVEDDFINRSMSAIFVKCAGGCSAAAERLMIAKPMKQAPA